MHHTPTTTLATAAEPLTPEAEPARSWAEHLIELEAAVTDYEDKTHLSDSVALGREPTADETAIFQAASERETAALKAVLAYPVASWTAYAEKTAALAEERVCVCIEDEVLEALAADAARLAYPPADPDAELVELGRRWIELGERVDPASIVSDDAFMAMLSARPPVPSNLMVSPRDALDFFALNVRSIGGVFAKEAREKIERDLLRYEEEAVVAPTETKSARVLRARAVIAGYAELQASETSPAYLTAKSVFEARAAEFNRLEDEREGLEARILLTIPSTLAGLLVKAQLASPRQQDENYSIPWSEELFHAVLGDLRQMVHGSTSAPSLPRGSVICGTISGDGVVTLNAEGERRLAQAAA